MRLQETKIKNVVICLQTKRASYAVTILRQGKEIHTKCFADLFKATKHYDKVQQTLAA